MLMGQASKETGRGLHQLERTPNTSKEQGLGYRRDLAENKLACGCMKDVVPVTRKPLPGTPVVSIKVVPHTVNDCGTQIAQKFGVLRERPFVARLYGQKSFDNEWQSFVLRSATIRLNVF